MEDINLSKISPVPQIRIRRGPGRRNAPNPPNVADDQEVLLNNQENADAIIIANPNPEENQENEEEVDEFPELIPSTPVGERFGKVVGMVPQGAYNTMDVSYESLNYELSCCRLRLLAEGPGPTTLQRLMNFPVMVLVGVLTGLTAFLIMVSIDMLSDIKYLMITKVFDKISEDLSDNPHTWLLAQGLMTACGLNLIACGVAGYLGVNCPVSCGSGIPHIKAYLNGVNIPKLLRFRTFLHKVLGVIFSVVGGLPVGKEGPMIHAGAIHGGGFSQGLSTSWSFRTRLFKNFRNDAAKRDFVAGGAAAGVAAAFGAPLGGVLFAIEEGCSFIDVPTILQILVGTASSYFVLNMSKSLYLGTQGDLTSGGLINFGYFQNPKYDIVELMIFILIGVIGGLLGALWNYLNAELTRFRMRMIRTKWAKFFEVLVVSIIVTSLAFTCMTSIKDCKYINTLGSANKYFVSMNCEEGKYHAGAAIWFETPENSVKDMFHSELYSYNVKSLTAFAILYFFISCLTYGLSISSGLFIPSLLIGAAWGRLLGMGFIFAFPQYNFGDLGKFSLMGASAQLSGIVRLTVSLCVILIEATGGMTYAFPILIVVIVAKSVGDSFNHGIYDIHLTLSGVPILDWKAPRSAHMLSAKDVMASPVVCLTMRSSMRDIQRVMQGTNHNAFPIVDPPTEDDVVGELQQQRSFGKLRGIILRTDITTMVFHELYDSGSRVKETWELFEDMYPRYIHTDAVTYDMPFQESSFLDFRNIMNPAPQTCSPSLGFDRVFGQFRTTGARHIVVVNDSNEVIGMVTRKDLCRPISSGSCGKNGLLKARTMVVPSKTSDEYRRAKITVV